MKLLLTFIKYQNISLKNDASIVIIGADLNNFWSSFYVRTLVAK